MIRFNAAPAFDFDEWVALRAADPEAFEARRRALLAIEVARGGARADAVRRALDALDAELAGLAAPERTAGARRALAASTRALSDRLAALSRHLRQAAAAPPAGQRAGTAASGVTAAGQAAAPRPGK